MTYRDGQISCDGTDIDLHKLRNVGEQHGGWTGGDENQEEPDEVLVISIMDLVGRTIGKNPPNKLIVRIPSPSSSEIHEQQADTRHDDEPNEKRKGSRNDAWIGVWYQGKFGADDEHLEGNAVA